MSAYQKLENIFTEYTTLKHLNSFLQWDSAVNLPPNSIASRANQIALIESYMNRCLTSPHTKKYLAKAIANKDALTQIQAANLREMEYHLILRNSIPQRLSQQLATATLAAQADWLKAKAQADFQLLRPSLTKVVKRVREKAQCLGERLECKPYEALIYSYDPNRKQVDIDPLFEEVERLLKSLTTKDTTPFVKQVTSTASQETLDKKPFNKIPVDVALQKKIIRHIAKDFEFPFANGRIDETEHPFTEGCSDDIRIALHYKPDDLLFAINSFLHEYGHAVYDINLPSERADQPLSYDRGMTIHEGCALFYEMFVGKTKAFSRYLYKVLEENHCTFAVSSPEHLHQLFNQPKGGHIRIEAGLFSYINHIRLRYEIERELIAGDMEVGDIPEKWRLLSQQLFSKEPRNDAEGCLQDIHWAMGLFGYFPCYGLGLIAAGQLYQHLMATRVLDQQEMGSKCFKKIQVALTELVFSQGSRFASVDEMFQTQLGAPLNPSGLIARLKAVYQGLL